MGLIYERNRKLHSRKGPQESSCYRSQALRHSISSDDTRLQSFKFHEKQYFNLLQISLVLTIENVLMNEEFMTYEWPKYILKLCFSIVLFILAYKLEEAIIKEKPLLWVRSCRHQDPQNEAKFYQWQWIHEPFFSNERFQAQLHSSSKMHYSGRLFVIK